MGRSVVCALSMRVTVLHFVVPVDCQNPLEKSWTLTGNALERRRSSLSRTLVALSNILRNRSQSLPIRSAADFHRQGLERLRFEVTA